MAFFGCPCWILVFMPQVPIIMPQLGESIAEATVIRLLIAEGATVDAGQDIIEVETNKATMNVTSPCRGTIHKFQVDLNESYPVGAILGQVAVTQEEVVRLRFDSSARARA